MSEPVESLFAQVTAYLDTAEAALQVRDGAALAALDVVGEDVLARLADLNPDALRSSAEALELFAQRLAAIQQEMLALQAQIGGDIAALNKTKQANHAYQTVKRAE